MCKGTEWSPGAVASLLDIVAFSGLVNLWMELLLSSCVAVLAGITLVTVHRVTPLIVELYVRTRRGPVRVCEEWGVGV